MGTRNLTIVINERKTVVAQYGQWDGYPEGQGATVLEFLKAVDLAKFKEKLKQVRFIDKTKEKEIKAFCESIGSKDGWMNGEQAKLYHEKYPLLTRDNGADILNLLYNFPDGETAWIHNERAFAADSLFCEWAYVIDLDKEVLEVYEGFNQQPLGKGQRFKGMKLREYNSGDTYYPVRCIKKFKFSELPETVSQFADAVYRGDYSQKDEWIAEHDGAQTEDADQPVTV
jgi:hypothetical protein